MSQHGRAAKDWGLLVRHSASAPAAERPGLLADVWRFWKAYAECAAAYQSAALLSLVYYVALGPSTLIARLSGNTLLATRVEAQASYWRAREPMEHTLAALERQF